MDEHSARRIVLVRAFDGADSPLWTADDAAWATRLAAQTVPAAAPPQQFLAERAHHALQRIGPREPGVARWLARGGWRWSWLFLAALLGALLGLAAEVLGRSALVDVLAPPAWAVIAWNVIVYVALVVGLVLPAGRGGVIRRALLAWWRRAVGRGPLREATVQWAALSARLNLSRVATLLHVAAAAVGAGLVAGLYLRGLVFDYRAGWQSTFLDAETVQRTLALLLAPATALTGIGVPDIAAMEAIRLTPAAPQPTASAAPWIHLYAAMLGLFVVGPRLLLAAASLLRAAWQAGHVALPLDDVYAQGLLRQRRVDGVAVVRVCPHAAAPSAGAALQLRAVLAGAFGDGVQLQMAELTRPGDEDAASSPPAGAAPSLQVALVDLGTTPEPDSHGRFIAALRRASPATPLLLLADEAAFVRRFGTLPGRVDERRGAWREFAQAQGVALASIDLDKPDAVAAQAAVKAALAP
jgi:Protein of unknown function (DUF2868)